MKTTSFDSVFASAPINKAAAVATSRSRENFEFAVKASRKTLDVPPLMTRDERKYKTLDLRGQKYARMIVLGLAEEQNYKKNSRWVVRCSCGKYEFRKARAIRNPANANDCCTQCERLRGEQYRQTKSMYGEKAAERINAVQNEAAKRQKQRTPIPISRAEVARAERGAALPEFMRERAEEVLRAKGSRSA